jgi:hypothetical protein
MSNTNSNIWEKPIVLSEQPFDLQLIVIPERKGRERIIPAKSIFQPVVEDIETAIKFIAFLFQEMEKKEQGLAIKAFNKLFASVFRDVSADSVKLTDDGQPDFDEKDYLKNLLEFASRRSSGEGIANLRAALQQAMFQMLPFIELFQEHQANMDNPDHMIPVPVEFDDEGNVLSAKDVDVDTFLLQVEQRKESVQALRAKVAAIEARSKAAAATREKNKVEAEPAN